jgi:uncharacterized membrane-anchored protein YhcB (DUF1043 family)
MNIRTPEEIAADIQKNVDRLCDLAQHPDTTRSMMIRFVSEEKPDLNAPDSISKQPAVYLAALSGNAEVLQYLIEEMGVNLNAERRNNNLFYFAMQNSSAEVKKYLSDPVKKIWEKFKDKTSELHAAVFGNRIKETVQILHNDPERLIEENQKEQSIFFMANQRGHEKIAAELITFGFNYVYTHKAKQDWANIATYYHQLADYYKFSSTDSEQKQACYESSIHYYQKAIPTRQTDKSNQPELLHLLLRLAACQLEHAHMSLTRGNEYYEKQEWRRAVTHFTTSERLLDTTSETYQQLQEFIPECRQTIRQLENEKIDAMISRACIHFEIGKVENDTDNKLAEYQTSIKLTETCLSLLQKIPAQELSAEDQQSFLLCYKQLATFHHDCGRVYQAIGNKAAKESAFAKASNTGFQKAIRYIEMGLELHEHARIQDQNEYESLLRLLAGNQYQNYCVLVFDIESREPRQEAMRAFLLNYPCLIEALCTAIQAYEKISAATLTDKHTLELCKNAHRKVEDRYKNLTALATSKQSLEPVLSQAGMIITGSPLLLAQSASSPNSPDRFIQTSSNLFQPRSPPHQSTTAPRVTLLLQASPTTETPGNLLQSDSNQSGNGMGFS